MIVSCSRLWRMPLVLAGALMLLAATAGAQEPAAADAPRNGLSGLQQPGDDVVAPLSETIRKPDKQREKSLAWYMDALAAQKEGDFTSALKSLEKAVAADPQAPEPVKAQALLLMGLGRMAQAKQVARKAIELDADDYETRMRLAVLLLAEGDATETPNLLDEALASGRLKRESPEFIQLHSVRGRLSLELRDSAKAAESYAVLLQALERPEEFGLDFRQHNALMSDRNTGYQAIGTVMLGLGRTEDAIAAFQALARVNEDSPGDYHLLLAQAFFRADRIDEAEKSLDTYFETHRRNRESLELLRDLYAATGRDEQVVERLKTLSEDTKDVATVNLFLGELYLEQGDSQAATQIFDQVIEETGVPDAYLGLLRVDILARDASALLATMHKALRARIKIEELRPLANEIAGDKEFAEAVVDACLKQVADDGNSNDLSPLVTYLCSSIAQQLELPEKQAELLQATLARNPGRDMGVEVLEQLAGNQLGRDEYADAAVNYRKLLSVSGLPEGNRVMALYYLSFAESYNGNNAEALTAAQAALQIRPQNAELTYHLGWVQVQAEDLENAEASLREAMRLSSGDASVEHRSMLLLGAMYSQQERWSEAIKVYSDLIENPTADEEMIRRGRMALSNAYVRKGDNRAGEQVLEEVYKTNPDDPGVNNDLGYLYADQNKNLEQAEKMIRLAVEAEPENPAYLDSLGWVLYRLGKNEEALEALKKANSDPDYRDSTIMEHLGDVQQALGRADEASKTWQEAIVIEEESTQPDTAAIERIQSKLPKQNTDATE